MFVNVHSSIGHGVQKAPPKCPLPDRWIHSVVQRHNGMSLSHERNGALAPTVTGMDLENMMFSEGSPTWKDNTVRSHSHEVRRMGKFTETKM